jgi:alanine dehydrogenase
MLIGVPQEIKQHERRVAVTPAGARELASHRHDVLVQAGAGEGAGFSDADYRAAGAEIARDAGEVFARADLVVKVKEPQPSELHMLRSGQVLFTYLHLAPDRQQTQGLVGSGAVAIGYETVTAPDGSLPLLAPMSEVAGRMSVQVGAACLEMPHGGRGVLLGGVPGVEPAHVVVLGAGTAGTHAVRMAVGMGARVTVVDRALARLRHLDDLYGNRIATLAASAQNIEESVLQADLVIGAVLLPGAAAPHLVDRAMVHRMRRGAAVVDISIDQGGCFETSRPTTHAAPTYVHDGVVHYCVTNMPGAVPRTSTLALTNATLPYLLALADKGWRRALLDDPHLRAGLNVCHGEVTCRPVADALGYAWRDAASLLA